MTTAEKTRVDTLWSKAIKERDGFKCRWCSEVKGLQSHHIVSRINYKTRWTLKNGLTLCSGCHKLRRDSAHNNPLEWEERFEKLGINKDELKVEARGLSKRTFWEVIQDLYNEIDQTKSPETYNEVLKIYEKEYL